jgi:hypothetical protein
VSGLLWGALGVLGGLGMTAVGDMVSEEVRDRLDHLPHGILRLAALRLDPDQRAAIYDDEWMPELTYILKGDEARPVTRLYHGVRYALGILAAARRITCELGRAAIRADAQPHAREHIVPIAYLAELSTLSRKIHRLGGGSLGQAEVVKDDSQPRDHPDAMSTGRTLRTGRSS